MNKKFFFLTLFLLGGLCIPQTTRPIFFIITPKIAALIGSVFTTATIYNAFYPSRVSNFITDQDRIKFYKASIQIYTKEKNKKTIIVDEKVTAINPSFLITQLNNIAKRNSYYSPHATIRITPTVTLINNKKYTLNPIHQADFSQTKLINRLTKVLFVSDSELPRNVKSVFMSFGWIFVAYHKISDASLILFNTIALATYFA
jgi:hypothetical protein